MITISELSIYPIKSIGGNSLQECEVETIGLQYDRRWALVDENNVVITARKYPQLLDLKSEVGTQNLSIYLKDKLVASTPLQTNRPADFNFQIWRQTVQGSTVDAAIDQWFSDFLKMPCRLIFRNEESYRPVHEKNGGKEGDNVSFADSAPILLVSEASLADINSKIAEPVGMERFRPNIVVKGCEAFAEDTWNTFRIGDAEFEVLGSCIRCVLTTIDPISKNKHPKMEPLRTLGTYRKHQQRGGAIFGVHVIPRKLGRLRIGDSLVL